MNCGMMNHRERRLYLGKDNAVKIECAGEHHDADHRCPHREFVRDHLRRRTKAAHQAVLAVRRPTGESDPVNADRRNSQNKQDANIDASNGQRQYM